MQTCLVSTSCVKMFFLKSYCEEIKHSILLSLSTIVDARCNRTTCLRTRTAITFEPVGTTLQRMCISKRLQCFFLVYYIYNVSLNFPSNDPFPVNSNDFHESSSTLLTILSCCIIWTTRVWHGEAAPRRIEGKVRIIYDCDRQVFLFLFLSFFLSFFLL